MLNVRYIIAKKIGTRKETNTALIVIDKTLIAPSIFPFSSAFAVPMAWEAVPKLSPLAMGCWIRQIFKITGPNIAPLTPAIMTKTAASETFPPAVSVILMAIGAVTDLAATDWISQLSNPKSFAPAIPVRTPVREPANIPILIAPAYFFIK